MRRAQETGDERQARFTQHNYCHDIIQVGKLLV